MCLWSVIERVTIYLFQQQSSSHQRNKYQANMIPTSMLRIAPVINAKESVWLDTWFVKKVFILMSMKFFEDY